MSASLQLLSWLRGQYTGQGCDVRCVPCGKFAFLAPWLFDWPILLEVVSFKVWQGYFVCDCRDRESAWSASFNIDFNRHYFGRPVKFLACPCPGPNSALFLGSGCFEAGEGAALGSLKVHGPVTRTVL